MKKALCIIIILSLCILICSSVSATDFDPQSTLTSSVEIVTMDAFESLFSNEDLDLSSIHAEYSYIFEIDIDNSAKADVTLTYSIIGDTFTYPFVLNGTIDMYTFDDGSVLWEGPIEGNTIIDGHEYLVIASFSKYNNDDITVGVTMQAHTESAPAIFVAYAFGTGEIPANYVPSRENTSCESNALNQPGSNIHALQSTNSSDNFQQFESTTAGFLNENSDETILDVRFLYEPTLNKLAICLNSITENVESYYDIPGYSSPESYVYALDVRLTRGEYTAENYSYIVGLEDHGAFSEYGYSGNELCMALFEDTMSLLGVPTSTISYMFESVYSSVVYQNYTNSASLNIQFSRYFCPEFDNCEPGVPIVFQLYNAGTAWPQIAWYEATVSMRYVTFVYSELRECDILFYTTTEDAVEDLPIIMPE